MPWTKLESKAPRWCLHVPPREVPMKALKTGSPTAPIGFKALKQNFPVVLVQPRPTFAL